jgi:WD40 repeat protein
MLAMPNRRPNPYPGPRAFKEDETLYGRDREVADLLDLLIAERIVLFYSPSGAGKSSLIQAALKPRLVPAKFDVLPVVRVSLAPPRLDAQAVPGANRYVLSALLSLEEGLSDEQKTPRAELFGMCLTEYLDRRRARVGGLNAKMLIFDQFEEIVTVNPIDEEAKSEFFAQVGVALRDRHRWGLFAMREDYIAALDPYLHYLPTRLRTSFRLDLLREDAARLAIQQPARVLGIDFSDEAATKLVDDLRSVWVQQPDGASIKRLGPYVEPVQLQVVCRRLWSKLSLDAKQILATDVTTIGDALEEYFSESIEAVARKTDVRERDIRDWFDRRLITQQGLRGQVLQGPQESQGLDNQAISLLVDAHLVRAEKRHGLTWFELAHDRLIEPVRKNNDIWRKHHLNILQLQAEVWEARGCPDGLLLRHQQLEEAERWAAAHPKELMKVDQAFLEACQEAREQAEQKRRLRRHRFFIWIAIASSLVSILTVSLLVWAIMEGDKAKEEGNRAKVLGEKLKQELEINLSGNLTTAALESIRDDPELSVLLAREAVSKANELLTNPHPEATESQKRVKEAQGRALNVLNQAVQASRVRLTLSGHADDVNGLAFNQDGTWLVTASNDTTAKVWNVSLRQKSKPRKPVFTLEVGSKVNGAAFSPDGKRVATASEDKTAKVWNLSAKQSKPLFTLTGHTAGVNKVVFKPGNGQILATASDDKKAKLWRISSAGVKVLHTFSEHTKKVNTVAFSPDGKQLATAGDDKKVIIWDVDSGRKLTDLIDGFETELKNVRLAHLDAVSGIAFSPDGQHIATASEDATAKIWDVSSGTRLRSITGHNAAVRDVAFHPDGIHVATVSRDTQVKVWNAVSGQELLTLLGHTETVTAVAFTPDGKHLATAADDDTARVWDVSARQETLHYYGLDKVQAAALSKNWKMLVASTGQVGRLWDISTGEELFTLTGHKGSITAVAFDPTGNRAASAGDKTIYVWDARSRKLLLSWAGHDRLITNLIFSQNGKRLASIGIDRMVKVWDVWSGRLLFTLISVLSMPLAVAMSPDGRFLAAPGRESGDNSIAMVWDIALRKEYRRLRGHKRPVFGVAFSKDGKRLATVSADTTAKIWDFHSGFLSRTIDTGHKGIVYGVAFSPDGKRMATAGQDKTVKVWDSVSGKQLLSLPPSLDLERISPPPARVLDTFMLLCPLSGHTDKVLQVVFSPDGKLVATGSWDNTAKVWDAGSGKLLFTLRGHKNPVNSLAFSPDASLLVTASLDGRAKLWDTTSGNQILGLTRHPSVLGVAFSANGKYLATGGSDNTDNSARVWDVFSPSIKEWRVLAGPKGHKKGILAVDFSPDGKLLATGSRDNTAKIWHVTSGKVLHTLRGHTAPVCGIGFSFDGKQLATASRDKTAIVWDAIKGKQLYSLKKHINSVWSVAFSPDGKRLATASLDRKAMIWDVSSGELLLTLTGHTNSVFAIAFSPDGKRLATGGMDRTTRVWDAFSGKPLLTLTGHTASVRAVAFSKDSSRLVTVSFDKTMRVYLLNLDELMNLANERVTRKLTKEERKKYLHE